MSFWAYLLAAFSFRPAGMIVAPNWVLLGVFALLGLLNPGFWLIGGALEIAYLLAFVTNERFRRMVERGAVRDQVEDRRARVDARVQALSRPAQDRFRRLEERCGLVLGAARPEDHAATLEHRADALGRLLDVYLQLLGARDVVVAVLSGVDRSVGQQLNQVQSRLEDEDLTDELRRSLQGQSEVLEGRRDSQKRAEERLEYIDSELARVEQQIELLREQAILDDPSVELTARIDELSGTLQHTRGWLAEQRRLEGLMAQEAEPVPLAPRVASRRLPQ